MIDEAKNPKWGKNLEIKLNPNLANPVKNIGRTL